MALYNKAVANNDAEIAKLARERIEKAKLETINRNRARARESARRCYLKILPGDYEWKQPKSNIYTDYQKQVLRGEISIEKVRTILINDMSIFHTNNRRARFSFS